MVQGQPYSITTSFTDFDTQNSWTVAWGDGTTASSGTGAIPAGLTHTYSSGAGAPYTITANVVTNDGTYTNSTTVDEAMPTLSVTGGSSVVLGSTYTLTDSFSDPAGLSPTGWTIDWGDGSSQTTLSGNPTDATHVYTQTLANSGGFTVAAYAVDADGTYYASPDDVTVTPATPTLSLDPIFNAGVLGYLYNGSTNPGHDTITGWVIAWGDGTSSEYPGDPGSFPHIYQSPGNFAITATAQADSGNQTAALSAAVGDSAQLTVESGTTATQNLSYYFSVAFSSPVTDEVPTHYVVHWGDSTISAYGVDPDPGGLFAHIYSTYGTLAIEAEVDTNLGTYTTSAEVDVQPNISFGFADTEFDTAEAGEQFQLPIYYNGADPIPTYTMTWGDTSMSTSNSRVASHVYTYDPNYPVTHSLVNGREFTLTAAEGLQTVTLYGEVAVYPVGAGAVISDGVSNAVEGQYATLGAELDDSDFVDNYNQNSEWDVNWGDYTPTEDLGGSTIENDPAVDTHLYTQAGTYNVVWNAVYEDADAETYYGGAQDFDAVMTEQVVVGRSPGTASVSDAGSATVGQPYGVSPAFTNSPLVNETAQQWTIDWGDGKSNLYMGPVSQYTHIYETAGTYSIDATVQTNEGEYVASTTVSVVQPSAQFTTTLGAASEQSQGSDTIIVSRSVAGDQPLVVNFSTAGTANASEYDLTDPTGQMLTGSVTIPAGSQFGTILVTAREDQTPAWTDTLDLTLGSGSGYALGSPGNHLTDIDNHDLGVTLGDGSGNLILDGSSDGTQNLVPLVLNYPPGLSGASLTLSISNDTEADVWTTPNPTAGSTPILGDVNGTYVSSHTWVGGVNYATEQTFWVGGTGGSTNVGDLDFTFAGSDANATTDPASPTTESATSKPATNDAIQITPLNNPNGSTLTNWSGQTIPWLIGQMVALQAKVVAPNIKNAQFQWTIADQNLTGRVTQEPADWSTRKVLPVAADDGGNPLPDGTKNVHSGLKQEDLVFFWYGTSSAVGGQAQSENVQVKLANTTLPAATVTFSVYTPGSNTSIYSNPLPGSSQDGLFVGLLLPVSKGVATPPNQPDPPIANPAGGVQFNAKVFTPQPPPPSNNVFHAGTIHFVQIMQINRSADSYAPWNGLDKNNPANNFHMQSAWANQWVLDENDPYGIQMQSTGKRLNGSLDDPFTVQEIGWGTDSGWHHAIDRPGVQMIYPGPPLTWDGIDNVNFNDSFQTFLMYQPSGNKPAGQITQWDSQWVPLAYTLWSFQVSAKVARGPSIQIVGQPVANIGTEFSPTTTDVPWGAVVNSANEFNVTRGIPPWHP
ncbi:MAG TPA: hypothetical protein VK797_07120 [Tepidisphaeraceae bacterium]|nr:hypothetical protein [Tepidisphaeraceae bacterium]